MNQQTIINSEMLTEGQTAAILGLHPQTLAVWRCTKRYALPYVKVGHLVRYLREDLESWLRSRKVEPGGNGGGAAQGGAVGIA